MRFLGLTLVAPIACFAFASLASGCASAAPEPQTLKEATSSRDAAIVADFNRDLGTILDAADTCRNDQSDACLTRAFSTEGVTARSAAVHPQDTIAQNVAWLRSLTKRKICQKLAFAIPFTRQFTSDVRLYFLSGIGGSGGAAGIVSGGAEVVWELTRHQQAAFTFVGLGGGNIAGISVGGYMGVAVSALGGDLIGNWQGQFLNANVGISIPETDIGVDIITFRDTNVTSVNGLTRGVQGLAVGGSIGINVLNPGVAVSAGTSFYRPHDDLTASMNGRGTLSYVTGPAGARYRQFRDGASLGGYRLSAGGLQAIDILWYGVNLPQLLAAFVAYGVDKLNESGVGLEDWCSSELAALPCGGGDVTTASLGGQLTPRTCAGADLPEEPTVPAPVPHGFACVADNECKATEVCSTDAAGAPCCRATFDASTAKICQQDGDCATGELCRRGGTTGTDGVTFTCIDPKKNVCSDGKP